MSAVRTESSLDQVADLDPTLVWLPAILARFGPDAGWQLHDARWIPGEHCHLAFRSVAVGQDVGDDRGFVAVELTSTRWSAYDYRDDPALPGLSKATDVTELAERGLFPNASRWHIVPVRYRPGSRCVLRWQAETPSGQIDYYAKVMRPGEVVGIAAAARALATTPAPAPLVATVVGEWAGLDVMISTAIDGPRASTVLAEPGLPVPERRRLSAQAGDLLARFHARSDIAGPLRSAADRVRELAELMPAICAADPALTSRAEAVLSALAGHLPEPATLVLGHGGFRLGQLIVTPDGGLTAVDLDGICHCDPARDLASALAHQAWQAMLRPQQSATAVADALVDGYEARAGVLDPTALRWWWASALLMVAGRRYRRLETAHWPFVPGLLDAAERLLSYQRTQARRVKAMPLAALVGSALTDGRGKPPEVSDLFTISSSPKRTVVRCTVRLDGSEPAQVVAKIFTERYRAELLYAHLVALTSGPFRFGPFRVPEPLGFDADSGVVVFRRDAGIPLDQLPAGKPTLPGVRDAARWLARLHGGGVDLPRRLDLEREAITALEWATVIGEQYPDQLAAARRLATAWPSGATPPPVGLMPIHKDFHAGHVLIGDGVCVIDLDEARVGDRAFDVVHFCSYLELQLPPSLADQLQKVFTAEYQAAAAWEDPDPRRLAAWRAYTWLKIAKQWTVGSGPGRGAAPERRRLGVTAALAKGAECLAR
jgi:aminoglycoside phosphotransferase (APT) family kinase protein